MDTYEGCKAPKPSLCDTCMNAYNMPGGRVFIGADTYAQRYCDALRISVHTDGKTECEKYVNKVRTYTDVALFGDDITFFENFGGKVMRSDLNFFSVWPNGVGAATGVVPVVEAGMFYISQQDTIQGLRLAAAACYHLAKYMNHLREEAGRL